MTGAPSAAELPRVHSGKVRDLFEAGEDRLLMVASDRVSAFDVIMAEPVPDKGRVLTAMTWFWCEEMADVVPGSLIAVDPEVIEAELGAALPAAWAGRAVLVHTGWDQHWRTDQYLEGHPYLTGALAQWLLDAGALLVGIDSHNIDCTDGGERPVHSVLLRHDIPIVEHLCGLAAVPEHGARFFAMPVKVKGFGTFPVRAFAMLDR